MADKRDSQPTIGMRPSAAGSAQEAADSDQEAPDSDEAQAAEDDGWSRKKEKLQGTLLAERYAVGEQLGAGGMGAVYVAQHVDLQKQVAIKVLHSEYGEKSELVQRFLQEAQAASRIRHENVIDITDFGKTPSGLAFFVMEYLEGTDLAGALGKGRFPWTRTEWIFMQVCDALRAAHNKGIIHRDLKPANIFLLERGGPDYVKLLDFGIAKLTDAREPGEKLTRTGTLFGTPQYMAPEQAAGREVDIRTDIYAMGCILYEMIAGRVPYEGDNFMHTLYMHLNEDLPDIADAVAGCGAPAALTGIVQRALAKSPDERFQTVDELLDTIMAVSKSEPRPALRSVRQITAPYGVGELDGTSEGEAKPSEQATKVEGAVVATQLGAGAFLRDGLGALETVSADSDAVATPAPTDNATPPATGGAPKWSWAVAALAIAIAVFVLTRSSGKEEQAALAPAPTPAPVVESVPANTGAAEWPTPPVASTQSVVVVTSPPGATVTHQDDTLPTPASLTIPAGTTWAIRIEKDGYRPVTLNTVLGQPKIVVELIPLPAVSTDHATKPALPAKNTKTTKTNHSDATKTDPKPDKSKDPTRRPNTDNPDPWGN